MTQHTITYDDATHQVVPREVADSMIVHVASGMELYRTVQEKWDCVLAAAPKPEAVSWTVPSDVDLQQLADKYDESDVLEGGACGFDAIGFARALLERYGRLAGFDFVAHLNRQHDFSLRTFGPGARTAGVVDHIRKELREVEESNGDLSEWTDVIILALDGALRSGATATEVIAALVAKQTKNEGRKWPDWHTADLGKAIEHVRANDDQPAASADYERGRHDGWAAGWDQAVSQGQSAASVEPVAWKRTTDITELTDTEPETDGWTPLYAAPIAAQAQPDEIKAMHAAARHAGLSFQKDEHGITRMVNMVVGEAQTQPVVNQSTERAIATTFRDRLVNALASLEDCYLSRESIEQAAEDVLHSFTAGAALTQQPSAQLQNGQQNIPEIIPAQLSAQGQTLADTQRRIIEAAEQRGYARGLADCAQDREDAAPDRDAVDLAREGMELHRPGQPEYIVCKELVRIAEARAVKEQ